MLAFGTARKGSLVASVSTLALDVCRRLPHSLQSNTIAALALWYLLWFVRADRGDPTSTVDLAFYLYLSLYHHSSDFKSAAGNFLDSFSSHVLLFAIPLALLALLAFKIFRKDPIRDEDSQSNQDQHCKALLFPSRTTHARFFPQKHSFAYSYLCVGVPVGKRKRYGSMLSVDTQLLPAGSRGKGWLHVQGEDHLERRGPHMDLKEKLSQYLQSQGISEDMWDHAYLVTAPRFLGYSFNPVSFWYIYSEKNTLKMMILEVNNTFDERRMYLLEARAQEDSKSESVSTGPNEDPPNEELRTFQNSWPKDFHVSPFNDREGSYKLSAHDPFGNQNGPSLLYSEIDLLARQDGKRKLNAVLFSEGDPIDPTRLTALGTVRFLLAWWWVGLVTFPRIVTQAYALFFKRKLRVFFRPEIAATSIPRHATTIEKTLETFFRRYLEDVISKTRQPLLLHYTPAAGTGSPAELKSPSAPSSSSSSSSSSAPPTLAIKVISPVFYSRFVHYSHTWEALNREGLCTDPKNATISISPPELLRLLPLTHDARAAPEDAQRPSTSFLDQIRWTALKKLRCPPAAPSYPTNSTNGDLGLEQSKSKSNSTAVEDIRSHPFSPLDELARRDCNDAWLYRRCVVQLFLAQRLAGGFTEALALADWAVRGALVWVSCWALDAGVGRDGGVGVRALGVVLFSSVHFWAFAKGL